MKKVISLAILALTAIGANAQYQFPNSTFDANFISSYGSYTEPEGWHGYASINASSLNSAGRAGDKLVQSTDVRSGAIGKCVYVKSTSIMGVVANGVMTNGQIYTHSTTATDGKNNYNYDDHTGDSSYGENNKFFTIFTGRPDYVKVWVKFVPKNASKGNARLNMILHKENTKMYDPEDNADKSIVIARATKSIPSCDWTQLEVPFEYVSVAEPGQILATFTTNETPGGGSDGDYLYIDDIEMVYLSTIKSATFNGEDIVFTGNSARVDANYKAKFFKMQTGAGAFVEDNFDPNTNILTLTIKGNDYSVNPSNVHTYTIQFNGMDSSADDEPEAVVTPETSASPQAPAAGWFYIRNKSTNNYITTGTKTSSTPHAWNLSSSNNATVLDENGNYLKIGCSLTDHSVNTSANAKDVDVLFNNTSGNYYQIYGSYKGMFSTYYTYLYDNSGSVSGNGSSSTADNYLWEFIPAQLFERVNSFWPNYSNASMSNGVEVKGFRALPTTAEETIANLPLGIYEVKGSSLTGSVTVDGTTYNVANNTTGKFYIPYGSALETALSDKNYQIFYYGRLDLSVVGNYNGTAITSTNGVYACDQVYTDKNKLSLTLGNGASEYVLNYDESTHVLTITVSGFGRSRETEVQMAAPDLSLNATWYDVKVEDNASINEVYDETKFVVNPGLGTTSTTSYDEKTGVVTVTISAGSQSKTYKIQFAVIPESVSSRTYNPLTVLNNGSDITARSTAMNFVIETLSNDNISFTFNAKASATATSFNTITAANLAVDEDGFFTYSDTLRNSYNQKLVPAVIRGQIKNGELQSASADVVFDPDRMILFHATYGLSTDSSKDYTGQPIVVTVNGDVTSIDGQTVTMGDLTNGNVNFTLKDFAMTLNNKMTYIGNIFLENFPIDADGNFEYQGGIIIGPGSRTVSSTWSGLELGIVPVTLRGQRYNNGNDIIVVIDIDMESLKQTIHVTYGAEPVGTPKVYTDALDVFVNGEETVVPNTKVNIGTLKNGNIKFTLKDFYMNLNGSYSPIGNIAIDNIALDAEGNFAYNGIIRIGKGTDTSVTWNGPDLGSIPVSLRGQCFDVTEDGNGENGLSHCQMVLDIQMESLKQTIHITFGTDAVQTKNYTDVLAVTVNGVTTTQNTTITVGTLRNGNINFILDNFVLSTGNDKVTPVGNIAIEDLALDAEGRFTYNGNVVISNGSDATVKTWSGPEMGAVPLELNGQIYTVDGIEYCFVNIDIDMEASLKQTINVTFGAKVDKTDTYTDVLKVTVNGEATVMNNQKVQVATLRNGDINFILNNFSMPLNGKTTYIGNIAINALHLDADGKFEYKGNVRIAAGTDPDDVEWAGPGLGAIPLDLKGQIYTYDNKKYIIVSIAIELSSIKQTVNVLFGGDPIREVEISDNLQVVINSQENNMNADVTVGVLRNGNINFILRNFKLKLADGVSNIGNLSVDNLEMDNEGNFSYNGVVRIGNGDEAGISAWAGPDLGDIPVVMHGHFNETLKKAYVTIDIDMMDSLSQIITVTFGADFATIANLVNLIEQAKAGNATLDDINTKVDAVLEK